MFIKKNNFWIHLIGSAVFLLSVFLFSPDWPNIRRMVNNPVGFGELVFQMEMVFVFYLNYYILVDRLYFAKHYFIYISLLIALFLFLYGIDAALMHIKEGYDLNGSHSPHPHPQMGVRPRLFILLLNKKLNLYILVIVMSLLIKIRQRFRIIQQQNISNELSFLKAQINPHFFFNTLNSIYALSLQKSDETPQAIVKLSGMMRYVIKETGNEKVDINSELNYIKDYIELQKLRITPNVTLDVKITGEEENFRIAPMLLIPFIENAFKYGLSTEEEADIFIFITISGSGLLHMVVKNKKVNIDNDPYHQTQLGLINVKKRLLLLYPGTHKLYTNDLSKEFSVDLSIQLND